MGLHSLFKNSYVFQFIIGKLQSLNNTWKESGTYNFLSSAPCYTTEHCTQNSSFISAASKVFHLLMQPLLELGRFFRQQARWSKLNMNNLNTPIVLKESQLWKTASGIRVESALWLLIFYPVIDFALRKLSVLNFLASGWDELLLLTIIMAWPLQMALRGKIYYRYTPLDIPIMIYAGLTLFLFFMRSWNVPLAIEGARVYLQYLLWFFAGSNLLLNQRQFNALMKGVLTVAMVVAVVGIFQHIIGVETPAEWVDKAEAGIQTRVFSIVVSPNVLGSLLIPFIMIAAGQLLSARKAWERWAYLGVLATLTACMIFTYSRGAWLALALAVVVFFFLYNPRLLIVAPFAAIAAIKLVPGIGNRFSYLFSSAYINSSQRGGRLALWQAALDKFKNDPIFGSGFGTFGGAVAARKVPGGFYVDNFYLKTLAESGIIGLTAFVWLILSLIRCGYSAFKSISQHNLKTMAAAILAGLVGVAAHNGVENIFEVPMMASYFWLLAGMLLALPTIPTIELPEEQLDSTKIQNSGDRS